MTVGIIPGEDRGDENPFVDVVIPSGLGMMRNFLVVQSSDIVVAIAGGSGTLCEMAIAWQKGKTLIAMSETDGWAGQLAGKRIDGRRPDTVKAAGLEELERSLRSMLAVGEDAEVK